MGEELLVDVVILRVSAVSVEDAWEKVSLAVDDPYFRQVWKLVVSPGNPVGYYSFEKNIWS